MALVPVLWDRLGLCLLLTNWPITKSNQANLGPFGEANLSRISQFKLTSALATLATAGALTFSSTAQAQNADSATTSEIESADQQGDDIIVTARRRSESAQDVPLAVTAFNAELLERKNIDDVLAISANVPGTLIERSTGGGANNLVFAIRGQSQAELSSVVDPSVSLYINDIPVPRSAGANVGFYDVGSVEVLKGPQGTLFGRNTTGGAVLVRTNQPVHEFEASLSQTVGSFGLFKTEGMINLPIGDTLALRVAASLGKRNGYITDVVTGQKVNFLENQSVRASLLFEPNDSLRSVTVGGYTRIRDGFSGGRLTFAPSALWAPGLADQATRPDPYTIASGVVPQDDNDVYTIDNTTNFELSDNISIKNIIGYREFSFEATNDLDGTRDGLFQAGKIVDHNQFSEEFQISGTFDKFDFIAGAFYFTERSNDQAPSTGALVGIPYAAGTDPVIEPSNSMSRFPFFSNTWAIAKNESYAAFVQGTYKITPELSLTAGLRYTVDNREMTVRNRTYIAAVSTTDQSCRFTLDEDNNPATRETRPVINRAAGIDNCNFKVNLTQKEPTYMVSMDYRVTPDALLYATYRRGYRAGGFGPRGANQVAIERPFESEFVDNFEIGLKADWNIGDTFLRTNIAAFYDDYKDVQRNILIQIAPPVFATENAASARIKGFEFEGIFRPVDALEFSGFYSYTDAKFTDYIDAAGNDFSVQPFPRAPKHQWAINARVILPIDPSDGELSFGAGVTYRDDYDFGDDYLIERNAAGVIDPIAVGGNLSQIIPSQTLVNARIDWNEVMGSRVDLSFYVENLFDEVVILPYQGINRTFTTVSIGDPRTFGLRARVKF